MNLATRKFALDIVNRVLHLHRPEENRFLLVNESTLNCAPVLYNKLGEYLVRYYFLYHQETIRTFCLNVCTNRKLHKLNFCQRVDSLIDISRLYDQCFEVFYNLCIKLTLLGFVAMEKGIADALSYIVDKIDILAAEAYIRGDLDEKFDCMFNFSYDTLLHVFKWSGCDVEMHWDLKKLALDSNTLDYFSLYASHFSKFLNKNGNTILNKFSTVVSKPENMNREVFVFQIQDWCDAYYEQLGELESFASLRNLLDVLMNISLLTVHAVGLIYPCSIRLAHESIVKLAISAEKHGILTSDQRKKLVIQNFPES